MTPEEIQKSIDAAYDSVNLINTLEALTSPTQEELYTIARNKEHLLIMLTKDWFSEALTPEQTAEISAASI